MLVAGARGFRVDGFVQLHAPFEDSVVDLDVLVEAVAGWADATSPHDQHSVHDRSLDRVWIDPRELDDDGDRGWIVGAVDIESRAKPRASRDEPRHLAEVGEELLHFGLHTVDVPAGHETIVPMGRILKASGLALGFVAYLWVAGVRNADRVKSRKAARRAANLVGANEREER